MGAAECCWADQPFSQKVKHVPVCSADPGDDDGEVGSGGSVGCREIRVLFDACNKRSTTVQLARRKLLRSRCAREICFSASRWSSRTQSSVHVG